MSQTREFRVQDFLKISCCFWHFITSDYLLLEKGRKKDESFRITALKSLRRVSMPTLYELVLGNLNDRRPLLYEQTVLTEV